MVYNKKTLSFDAQTHSLTHVQMDSCRLFTLSVPRDAVRDWQREIQHHTRWTAPHLQDLLQRIALFPFYGFPDCSTHILSQLLSTISKTQRPELSELALLGGKTQFNQIIRKNFSTLQYCMAC